MRSDQWLRIEIKNTRPVELIDLTNCLSSVADEYKRFMEEQLGDLRKEDVTLYLQEIKSGSIITDLVGISPGALPIFAHMSTMASVIKFGEYLKIGFDFLLGKITDKPKNYTRANYENFSGFVEPIAKDRSSQLNINQVINGNPTLMFTLSSLDANAAQNTATREIGLLRAPSTGSHRNVVLYWYQAKNDPASKTGDKVIIESICPYPVKVVFEDDIVKNAMLLGVDNPFTSAYIVDIAVETIAGRPILYKIVKMHSRIEIPPQIHIEY